MCLRVPDIPESLESTENTISYRIVVEGTQSPVYRNGTPVRVILRVRRTDSSVSEREGKGEKQHISCVSCLLCYLDAFHARYTRKVDMACLVALNISLRYTTMSSSFSENNDAVTMSFRSFQSLLNCRRCATTFFATCE